MPQSVFGETESSTSFVKFDPPVAKSLSRWFFLFMVEENVTFQGNQF